MLLNKKGERVWWTRENFNKCKKFLTKKSNWQMR